jgi:hypothetical protein
MAAMSAYELERQANIARNNQVLQGLGLGPNMSSLCMAKPSSTSPKKKSKSTQEICKAVRRSARTTGNKVDYVGMASCPDDEEVDEEVDDYVGATSSSDDEEVDDEVVRSAARKKKTAFRSCRQSFHRSFRSTSMSAHGNQTLTAPPLPFDVQYEADQADRALPPRTPAHRTKPICINGSCTDRANVRSRSGGSKGKYYYHCDTCDADWQQIPPHKAITSDVQITLPVYQKHAKFNKCSKCGQRKKGHTCPKIVAE